MTPREVQVAITRIVHRSNVATAFQAQIHGCEVKMPTNRTEGSDAPPKRDPALDALAERAMRAAQERKLAEFRVNEG